MLEMKVLGRGKMVLGWAGKKKKEGVITGRRVREEKSQPTVEREGK